MWLKQTSIIKTDFSCVVAGEKAWWRLSCPDDCSMHTEVCKHLCLSTQYRMKACSALNSALHTDPALLAYWNQYIKKQKDEKAQQVSVLPHSSGVQGSGLSSSYCLPRGVNVCARATCPVMDRHLILGVLRLTSRCS